MVADPGGIGPDPDPTFKNKTGSVSVRQEIHVRLKYSNPDLQTWF